MIVRCEACRRLREYPREQPRNVRSLPKQGDFWLCPACGALHRFTGGYEALAGAGIVQLHVRAAELEELEQLGEDLRAALLAKRAEIRGPAS